MQKEIMQTGQVSIIIDNIVPCLKECATEDIKETVVYKIESRSFLKNFNTKNNWEINWYQIPKDVEVYVLATKDNNEIQGIIGIKKDISAYAIYIHWACAAPHNNPTICKEKRYEGVGGHLFAIAAEKSVEYGFDGAIHGFAANEKLLKHYIETLGAEYLGMLHQYQFFINEEQAKKIREVYDYEWN